MSVLALHGFVAEERPAPEVALPAHRRVALGGLAALVSETLVALDTPEEAQAAALAHHALVSGWHRGGAVLPVRLGTVFSSEEALCESLSPRVTSLRSALAQLAGKDEMVLSFATAATPEPTPTPAPEPQPASGSDWLRARKAVRDRARAHGRNRNETLTALHKALVARGLPVIEVEPREGLAKWHLLIAREDRAGLDHWLAAQGDMFDDAGLEVALDGPWPPYGFAAELMEAVDG